MYNHNKAQQSKNRVHISWDILYGNTIRCRHPAGGQDLILLQSLHVFAHSRDPHPAKQLWCQVPFTKSKTIFQIEMYCMKCFLKSKYIELELSMIKIGESLRKLWSWRSCFLILPPGAPTPQGIEGAMKRDVSKHWCTLQWCARRGWVIAHENWTSWGLRPANERCRYKVTPSLIGWAQTWNQPCMYNQNRELKDTYITLFLAQY